MKFFLLFFGVTISAWLLHASPKTCLYYEGRLLDDQGNPQVSVESAAIGRCYATSDGTEILCEEKTVVKTDAQGYFAVTFQMTLPKTPSSEVWLGVSLFDGGTEKPEIQPRMRISTAPLAIRSVYAQRLESKEVTTFSGAPRVKDAHFSGGSVDAQGVNLFGTMSMDWLPENLNTLYLTHLVMGNGHLSILRGANGVSAGTQNYDQLGADRELALTDTTGFFDVDYSESGEMTLTAPRDGFVTIHFRSYLGRDSGSYYARASLRIGSETLFTSRDLHNTDYKPYILTYPVRQNDTVWVKLENKRATVFYDIRSYAKVKFFSFGK